MGGAWPDRPVCLDLTRTLSRVGGAPATGIDRVERAYLDILLHDDRELCGLIRHAGGISVLDRSDLVPFLQIIEHGAPGRRDAVALVSRKLARARAAAEAWVRRTSSSTVWRGWEGGRLRRRLPQGGIYLNVGHSNLTAAALDEIGAAARIGILVHDVIPLRYPEYQAPGATTRFADKLAAVASRADRVFCLSRTEAARVEDHLRALGHEVSVDTVPPGPTAARPDAAALPRHLSRQGRCFVALGTIEPRKNIDLLLDVWDRIAAAGGPVPTLVIAGRRGWASGTTLSRLDAYRRNTGPIVEVNDLSDGAVAALLAGAEALLFPTFAEGYGFPPHEALAHGTPVVCSDLDVLRETLGERVVYADPRDVVQWAEIVLGQRALKVARGGIGPMADTGNGQQSWRSHVRTVLSALD